MNFSRRTGPDLSFESLRSRGPEVWGWLYANSKFTLDSDLRVTELGGSEAGYYYSRVVPYIVSRQRCSQGYSLVNVPTLGSFCKVHINSVTTFQYLRVITNTKYHYRGNMIGFKAGEMRTTNT